MQQPEPEDVRFWVDEREYLAPRAWMVEAMSGAIKSGLGPTAALARAMEWWIKQGEESGTN